MSRNRFAPRARHLAPLFAAPFLAVLSHAGAAQAQTVIESSSEARLQLDFVAPAAVIDAYLPLGFTLNVAAQGPAAEVNLRAIFIDRQTIHDAERRPVGDGSNQLVYLTVPVRDPAGATGQLVIGGITGDDEDAPGPFGNYLPASRLSFSREISGTGGPEMETQRWSFAARGGEFIEMEVTLERAVGNRSAIADARFYSSVNPGYVEISSQEQVLDIARNTSTNPPDRVKSFTYRAGGGSWAKIFDGTERVTSWDNIPWLHRTVSVP
jgi:hypothetical protein